jgi:hypothetical protein
VRSEAKQRLEEGRQRGVRGAVARREFSHPDDRLLAAMAATGVACAFLLLVLVLPQT